MDNFRIQPGKPLRDIVQPTHDLSYAFFEKWESQNSMQESASGLAHIRLVIDQYKCRTEEVFMGHGYYLIKPAEDMPGSQKTYRASWEPNAEYFWANHYFSKANGMTGQLAVSRPNTYVYGGKVEYELCQRPTKDFMGLL